MTACFSRSLKSSIRIEFVVNASRCHGEEQGNEYCSIRARRRRGSRAGSKEADPQNSSVTETARRMPFEARGKPALQGREPEFGAAQVLWCRRCLYRLRARHAVPLLGKRHRRRKRDL